MLHSNEAFKCLDLVLSHQEFGFCLGCLLLNYLFGLLGYLFSLLNSFHLGLDSMKLSFELLLHPIEPDESIKRIVMS